ncbi:MAG: glycosyltransferase family 4 protein [Spirochaetes bacterium]|nr:glycosyltransferase family 4 protein [Spirochaetota bacterium]
MNKKEQPIRLLIDGVTIGSPGILQLKYELIESALENRPSNGQIILLQDAAHKKIVSSEFVRVDNVKKPALGWPGRWLWYHMILPMKIKKHKADVLYSLSGIISHRVRDLCATVITINNMLPFTPREIEHFRLLSKGRIRLRLLQKMYSRSARGCDALILHSRHAMTSISKYAGNIRKKSFVVLTGVPRDISKVKHPPHPNKKVPFLFAFSTVYWYKNYLNLIRGYKRASLIEKNLPVLIIAGFSADKKYVKRLIQEIEDFELKDRVLFLGTIPKDKIPLFMHHAVLNLFPSVCETNSVVQSEIMGMKGVMACSRIPPMTEVAGKAAVYFDPFNPDSIADAILMVCQDRCLQQELRKKAYRRALELSWKRCGQVIWQATEFAYKQYLNRNKEK